MTDRPRHLPADERRAVTVEAWSTLAAEQNPSEITTAAIAKHMNLTQGALFRHFPTKDAIWQAVMEWVAERLLARIDQAADAGGTARWRRCAGHVHGARRIRRRAPRRAADDVWRASACRGQPPKRMVQTLISATASACAA